MNRRRVLVTGANGFIGRHMLGPLQALGDDVYAVTHSEPAEELRTAVHWCRADLHDAAAVEDLLARVRPTHLLHAAWFVEPGSYLTSLENVRWVSTTLGLVEAFRRHGGRGMVGVGSSAEYGPATEPCREDVTPLAPATIYATCKRSVHDILARWSAPAGIGFGWARVFNLHGPGEPPSRLVPQLVRAGIAGAPFPMRHPGQRRDYLHVADVGRALVALLDREVQGAVNIGSGEGLALRDLATQVGACLGTSIALGEPGVEPDPAPTVVADVTRLRREVGFTPQFSSEEGLRDSVSWWMAWWNAHSDSVLT